MPDPEQSAIHLADLIWQGRFEQAQKDFGLPGWDAPCFFTTDAHRVVDGLAQTSNKAPAPIPPGLVKKLLDHHFCCNATSEMAAGALAQIAAHPEVSFDLLDRWHTSVPTKQGTLEAMIQSLAVQAGKGVQAVRMIAVSQDPWKLLLTTWPWLLQNFAAARLSQEQAKMALDPVLLRISQDPTNAHRAFECTSSVLDLHANLPAAPAQTTAVFNKLWFDHGLLHVGQARLWLASAPSSRHASAWGLALSMHEEDQISQQTPEISRPRPRRAL